MIESGILGLLVWALFLEYALGQNVLSLFPSSFQLIHAYTGDCIEVNNKDSVLIFVPCNIARADQQRWRLSATGLIVTSTAPYRCISANNMIGSQVYVTRCNPSSNEQLWTINENGLSALPQLANSKINICVAECKMTSGKACAYRPGNVPAGSCRTMIGSAHNMNIKAKLIVSISSSPTPNPNPVTHQENMVESLFPLGEKKPQLNIPFNGKETQQQLRNKNLVGPHGGGWVPSINIVTVTHTSTVDGKVVTMTVLEPSGTGTETKLPSPIGLRKGQLVPSTTIIITVAIIFAVVMGCCIFSCLYFRAKRRNNDNNQHQHQLPETALVKAGKISVYDCQITTSKHEAVLQKANTQPPIRNTLPHNPSQQYHVYNRNHRIGSPSTNQTTPTPRGSTNSTSSSGMNVNVSDFNATSGKTHIILECKHANQQDYIAMVGEGERFGEWDPFRAPAMSRHRTNPSLFFYTMPNTSNIAVKYKFAKISTNLTVTWMKGKNLVLQPTTSEISQAYIWEL